MRMFSGLISRLSGSEVRVRHLIFLFLILPAFFLLGSLSLAEEKPSPELIAYGEELFTTKKLGAKFECMLCHKGEKAISHSKVVSLGDKLPDVINDHIVKKSKGKAIAKDSQEMKALAAYITHKHSV